jgi:drug/metabolite transporter (DMT)-like permease
MTQQSERKSTIEWMPSFVALSVIWGSSFALIKVAVDADVASMWVALARCLFGALALLTACAVGRVALPRNPATWGHALAVAVLLHSLPFSLLAYGETQVSSVLAGIYNAATPLTTLLFVLVLVPQEQLTARRLSGLLMGFSGVLVVLGIWRGPGDATLAGSLACLASTASYGAGFAYTRRFYSVRKESATALTTAQLLCATAVLSLTAPTASGLPSWPGWRACAALLVLGSLGTGIAFMLNMRVIRAAGPTIASTVTYVVPLWSTLFGTVLLSEELSWNTAVGALIVVGGVFLAQMPSRRRAPAPAPAVATGQQRTPGGHRGQPVA